MRWPFAALLAGLLLSAAVRADAAKPVLPIFEVDSNFPMLPERTVLGAVGAVAADSRGNVWALVRPHSVDREEALLNGYQLTPPVIQWDKHGDYVRAWGGPSPAAAYQWPNRSETFNELPPCSLCAKPRAAPAYSRTANGEHGIYVDHKGNVWITSNGAGDGQILKFAPDGKFLLQIGHAGRTSAPLSMTGATIDSSNTENMSGPANVAVYPASNEVFVADGYGNRRVVVFDADSGQFKRHWGAYGEPPDDNASNTRVTSGPPARQFNIVHGLAISDDGVVYVADRGNNRIQAFTVDGKFLREGFNKRDTRGRGSTFAVALSRDPDQRFLYIADGSNARIAIMDRATLEVIGSIGRAGQKPGEFQQLHSIATDGQGNIITGETSGYRVQRFLYKGLSR